MSTNKTPRFMEYETMSTYDNPDVWPSGDTEFGKLVNYIQAATECGAITIHSTEEGREHATIYGKQSYVATGIHRSIRQSNFSVVISGTRMGPNQESPNSWATEGYAGEDLPYVEIKPLELLEQFD